MSEPTALATPPAGTPPQAAPATAISAGTRVGSDTPATVPAPAAAAPVIAAHEGDDSWKNTLPDEIKNDPTIKNVRTIADAMKMLQHSQKMIGADKIIVPSESTTAEEWQAIDRKLGVPEDIKKYSESIKVPDSIAKESPFLQKYTEMAHKLGVRPAQAEKLIEWFSGISAEAVKANDDAEKAAYVEELKGLKTEWGQAYDKNIASAQVGLRSIMDRVEADKIMDDPELGNNPKFIRIMHKIGALVGEDKLRGDFAGDMGAKAPNQAKSELNKIYGDMNGPFYQKNHPDHKRMIDEVTRLHEMARG